MSELTGLYRRDVIEYEMQRLRALASYRALPWYRRAWLTLTGKAPR